MLTLRPLLLIATASVAAAQTPNSAVRGIVVDSAGGPLSGVAVASTGAQVRGVTSEMGQFTLAPLPQGLHTIVVERAGFAPETSSVTLNEADTLDLRIVLRKVTVKGSIAAAVAAGSAKSQVTHAFDQRLARKGGGRFITKADIDKRNPRAISDLLRNVAGVRITDSAGMMIAVSTRGPRHEIMPDGTAKASECVLRVGLDGVTKDAGFAMDNISPHDVYGIEIFAGAATIPPEYGGMRGEGWCGLIMIWTRFG